MKPVTLKTLGYLISTISVGLLGAAAWPGAAEAGLLWALVAGMIASVAGMACRWTSYEVEARRERQGRNPKG